MKILVINGPNMNLLGKREKIYGSTTLKELNARIASYAETLGIETEFFQSNYEGAIVEKIQQAEGVFDGIIINPAAYTHTSIAIRDALSAVKVPAVEVHITNILAREEFRRVSITGNAAVGVIAGLGAEGYILALHYFSTKQPLGK
jgi:3-dehydroquinate dehydratase-2